MSMYLLDVLTTPLPPVLAIIILAWMFFGAGLGIRDILRRAGR